MRWKALDTNSEYQISDTGLLRRIHIFSLSEDKDGYLFTRVTSDQGERVNCRIHRLVLHAFDPRPNENELEVHHKDGNVQNNNIENLEYYQFDSLSDEISINAAYARCNSNISKESIFVMIYNY